MRLDPKYLSVLSSCHLAGISAWPADIRLKMLTTYNKNTNISLSMSAFERYLDSLVLTKKLSVTKMQRYVDLQSVIYDGCSKNVNSEFWRNRFTKDGVIDYYPKK